MDNLTPAARSQNMRRIRSEDTAPEIRVRRFLYRQGLRYRLHVRSLPGKPDVVFPQRQLCLFIHGCFWHGCPHCVDGRRQVKSNLPYWTEKIVGNRARDERHRAALEANGWQVLTIWECEVGQADRLLALAQEIRDSRALKTR